MPAQTIQTDEAYIASLQLPSPTEIPSLPITPENVKKIEASLMLLRVKEYVEKEPNRAFWIYGVVGSEYAAKSEILTRAYPGLRCEHMPAPSVSMTDFIKITRAA